MVWSQSRSVDQLSQHIWHTSLQMTVLPKERTQTFNIIDGIHKIKGKTSIDILVSNYMNKHLTFHKGEYIGHLKLAVLDSTDQQDTHQTKSMTLKK